MNYIKEIIETKKISQYSISKKSGIPYSTVSDICLGKTDIRKCNVETAIKLAKALDCTIEELVYGLDTDEAMFDESEPAITKFEYYHEKLKYRKNVILASESALEYLDVTDNNFSTMIKVYATSPLPWPFLVKQVKNFENIDYKVVDGILVSTISQALDDMLSDSNSDFQIVDQALNNYYYKNNESFEGIEVSNKNKKKLEKEKKIALTYYDDK